MSVGHDAAAVSPEVLAALSQIASALEVLKRQQQSGVDAGTHLLEMLLARKQAAPLSDDEVMQRSRELIEAFDRADVDAVAAALAPGFFHLRTGFRYPDDRDAVLSQLARHRGARPYVAQRTWSNEHVVRKAEVLVFTGQAHEVQAGNETHGGYTTDGWYIMQWVRADETWRVQFLMWRQDVSNRDRWNDTYRRDRGFSHEPNRFLVETAETEAPGTALELAMGQGRNALYLASQGWRVTGVDISDEALRVARASATERSLTIETVHADIDECELGEDRFDLVALIYAGEHARWMDKIKKCLRSGGLFVVEGWARRSDVVGFEEVQLANLFAEFEILRDELIDGAPDWSWDQGKLVRFVARKR